jgi:hypothetical protein
VPAASRRQFYRRAGRPANPPARRLRYMAVRKGYAAPKALGRNELKIPIKFSTRFENGRIQQVEF